MNVDKKAVAGICILMMLLLAVPTLSVGNQKNEEHVIKIKAGHFTPNKGLSIAAQAKAKSLPTSQRTHILLQFEHDLSEDEKQELESEGVKLLSIIPGKARYVSIPAGKLSDITSKSFVRAVDVIKQEYKVSEHIKNGKMGDWAIDLNGGLVVIVKFHRDIALHDAELVTTDLDGVIHSRIPALNALTVSLPPEKINGLASNDAVLWIEQIPPPIAEELSQSRAKVGVDQVQDAPFNLDGAGVNIMQYELQVPFRHDALGNRLLIADLGNPAGTVDHATHVAGIIAGDGTDEPSLRGVATEAVVVSYANNLGSYNSVGDTVLDYFDAIYDVAPFPSVDLASNSWGIDAPNCAVVGSYTTVSTLFDDIVRADGVFTSLGKPIPIIFSAGNNRASGSASCGTNYVSGPEYLRNYRTLNQPKSAKNIIVVGAINTIDESITTFSNFGPTEDDRVKPDLVAPGCTDEKTLSIVSDNVGINATNNSNGYSIIQCGTSFAAPHVSGIIALMLEQYRKSYPSAGDPLPSTSKGILIDSAKDLGNTGPDFMFGFGLVNATEAIKRIILQGFVEDEIPTVSSTDAYAITVPPNEPNLTVTLVWDDPAAEPFAASTLVNDLDLVLIDSNGTINRPLILNPNPGFENNTAMPGEDHTNNVEQVVINNPQSGAWLIRVNASSLPGGTQKYSLASSLLNRPTISTRSSSSGNVVYSGTTTRIFMDGSNINGRNLDVTLSWTSPGDTLTLRAKSPTGAVYTTSSNGMTTSISTGILNNSNGIWTIEVEGNAIASSRGFTTFTVTTFANAPPEIINVIKGPGGINFTSANLNYISTCDPSEVTFVMKAEAANTTQPILNLSNATVNSMDYFLAALAVPNHNQWITLDFSGQLSPDFWGAPEGRLIVFVVVLCEYPVGEDAFSGVEAAL